MVTFDLESLAMSTPGAIIAANKIINNFFDIMYLSLRLLLQRTRVRPRLYREDVMLNTQVTVSRHNYLLNDWGGAREASATEAAYNEIWRLSGSRYRRKFPARSRSPRGTHLLWCANPPAL